MANTIIDKIDRNIIEITQAGLPLTERPFQKIAKALNLKENEVISRMLKMHKNGVIRRIGAVPNHYALGYRFNAMTVWDIDDKQIEKHGNYISKLEFVSHCYERPRHQPEWPYNLFIMLHAKTEPEIQEKINAIKSILESDCKQYKYLMSNRILKKTGFRFSQNSN